MQVVVLLEEQEPFPVERGWVDPPGSGLLGGCGAHDQETVVEQVDRKIVTGTGFSLDRMLQGRLFAHADGQMLADIPKPGNACHEPNSGGRPQQNDRFREPLLALTGSTGRYDHRVGNHDDSQHGALFRSMSHERRKRLMDNIAEATGSVPVPVVRRQVAHFYAADLDYRIGVATRMGLSAAYLPMAAAAG